MTFQIAVVITCRNLGRYLGDALSSVERQTLPAAEIVIVDDASSDLYTRSVLSQLIAQGVRVVRTEGRSEGRGAGAARNTGARETTSRHLVWLDADDVLEPTYFEMAARILGDNPSLSFVSCGMQAFGAAHYTWTPSPPTFAEAIATGGVPHASTVVTRELWEAAGGFDETLPTFELLDFWAAVFARNFRGVVVDEPLLNYRIRPNSGYRRSLQPAIYRARLEHFYEKHREAVDRHAIDLLKRKEAFLHEQRQYRKSLEASVRRLEGEIAEAERLSAETSAALGAAGLERVNWGDLRRDEPVSPRWGRDRGTAVDRYYIEKFLASHQPDIKGRVLEIRDAEYTRRFGGTAVSQSDVLDIDPSNSHANIVADLRSSNGLPSAAYDCIILTQTLQLIDDIAAAIAQCERMLRPGGVLLATVPTTIRVDDEAGVDGDFWRLTEASARKLFAEQFPLDGLEVHAFGNVTACTAFLQGISAEELSNTELDRLDARFPLVVTIRAVKAASGEATSAHAVTREALAAVRGRAAVVTKAGDAIVLAYHRIAELTPDTHRLCTPQEVFRAHMEYVSRCCCPMSLPDLLRAAAEGAVPDRAIAVTLDDGYLDALTTASPILERFGVPATFFVNSDRIEIEHERHWDVFERIFLGTTPLPPEFAVNVGAHQLRLPTVTATDRIDTLEALHRAGWPLDEAARADLAAEVIAWSRLDCSPRPTHRVLTSAEVIELASRPGHSIGAHTTHHLALSTQPKTKKHREIGDDKRALEALLGSTVEWFAYPYGDFDGETVEAVREAGFTAAVTVEPGRVRGGMNRFLLPRVEVQRQDWSNFAARVGRP